MYSSFADLGAQPEPNRDHFSVLTLQDEQHKGQVIGQNRVVVVDIYADWCQPCKQTAAQYSRLADKYNIPGNCVLVKEDLSKKLSKNITGVPTFNYFVEGRLVDQVVGADMDEVEKKLQTILDGLRDEGPNIDEQQGPKLNSGMMGHPIRQSQDIMTGQTMQYESAGGQDDSPYQQPYQGNSGGQYNQPYQNSPAPQHGQRNAQTRQNQPSQYQQNQQNHTQGPSPYS